jgi:oligopeptide transport system permease protein
VSTPQNTPTGQYARPPQVGRTGEAVLATAGATATTLAEPSIYGEAGVEVAPGVLREAARRFFDNRLAVGGLVVATGIVLCALFADVLAPQERDYANFAEILQFPSREHPLGTDAVGRDFLTRVIYGARTSMLVGLTVPLLTTLIGVPLGAAAGWRGGWVDYLFLRVVEMMTALPTYVVALLFVMVWGGGVEKLILYFAVTGWVGGAWFARAQFKSLKGRDYVLAARAMGASDRRLMYQHILPNAAGPIIVALMTAIPAAIFGEAGLSFLGLGVQDPVPSWGKMLNEGGPYAQVYWHLALVPTLLIAATMLAFTFVGDGLRDALDPYMQR